METTFTPQNAVAGSSTSTGRGIASLLLGLVSLFAGWTLVAPIIGLCLGISARRREPLSRTASGWGIALNLFAMAGWLIVILLTVMFGGAVALGGLWAALGWI